jgi:hypothetical protein
VRDNLAKYALIFGRSRLLDQYIGQRDLRSRSGCSAPISRSIRKTSERRIGAIAGRSSGRHRSE